MERKFSQPVAMPCTSDQFKDLGPNLEEMGYINDASIGTHYGYIATKGNGKTDRYICIDEDLKRDYGRHVIDRYNPELFLALASMSDGDRFWPGEWVVSYGIHFSVVVNVDHVSGSVVVRFTDGTTGSYPSTTFRKATAEEIINHFEQKHIDEKAEQFADGMLKAVSEWVPDFEEEIWVWNKGDRKRRKERFFGFAGNRVAISYSQMNEGRVIVDLYDHFAKLDAPIIIPADYARNLIAVEKGVPVELIQIKP